MNVCGKVFKKGGARKRKDELKEIIRHAVLAI
jgi:hypothetical protein